jgi:GGDEF domain-containing protein
MELGSLEIQIFVSLVVVLGTAFVALVCDFLKGNNEQLRERNVELRVRHEERDRLGLSSPAQWLQGLAALARNPQLVESMASAAGVAPALPVNRVEAAPVPAARPEPAPLPQVQPAASPEAGTGNGVAERSSGARRRYEEERLQKNPTWASKEELEQLAERAARIRSRHESARRAQASTAAPAAGSVSQAAETAVSPEPVRLKVLSFDKAADRFDNRENLDLREELGRIATLTPETPAVTETPAPAEAEPVVPTPVVTESAEAAPLTFDVPTVNVPEIQVPAIEVSEVAATVAAPVPVVEQEPAEVAEVAAVWAQEAAFAAEPMSLAAALVEPAPVDEPVPDNPPAESAPAAPAALVAPEAVWMAESLPQEPLVRNAEATSEPFRDQGSQPLWSAAHFVTPSAPQPSSDLLDELAASVTVEPVTPEVVPPAGPPAVPAGMHPASVLESLIEFPQIYTGVIVAIGINDYESLREKLSTGEGAETLAATERMVQAILRPNDFACRFREDEFILLFPGESGASAQRRLFQVSEKLWDFQLRSLGNLSLMFSWGGYEVQSELLSEAVASARERMFQTKRSRKPAPLDLSIFRKRVVNG